MPNTPLLRIVVLISGNGSNLQAIIDQIKQKTVPAEILAVVSNTPNAGGLTRAKKAGIKTEVVNSREYESREAYDADLLNCIDAYQPDLVVLAGFMRILSEDFVLHYTGRMINIHPSLLPKFRGLNTHQRAIDSGETMHGVSVHYVTPELDGGPVILQSAVEIKPSETAEALAKRVQTQEHIIYPLVISWIALNRVKLVKDIIEFDNKPLTSPIQLDALPNPG